MGHQQKTHSKIFLEAAKKFVREVKDCNGRISKNDICYD